MKGLTPYALRKIISVKDVTSLRGSFPAAPAGSNQSNLFFSSKEMRLLCLMKVLLKIVASVMAREERPRPSHAWAKTMRFLLLTAKPWVHDTSFLSWLFVWVILSGCLLTAQIQAQNFPVRVTPNLTPPYTPFLKDLTVPGADKLTVRILLTDLSVMEYRCRLRLTIEGVNITITTSPNYVAPPLTLQGGVPELLLGSDLADYFRYENLQFKGIDPGTLQRNGGQLPEGIYRFTFEVIDYNRGTVVSNRGTTTAWMVLNDPPFINQPFNNAKLKPLDPQNIVFQWTPRHRGSPNAAFSTEYEVKLVEIWPKGRNPYDAIQVLPPIFETITEQTMVVYGPAETPLVPGREYALQVRARDVLNRDLFRNQGYSEVVKFTYGDECPRPTGIMADDIGTMRARMRWQGHALNSGYRLRYREQAEGAQWFEENVNLTYVTAMQMKPGVTYQYEVCGVCDFYESDFTTTETFTTLAENPNAFACGDAATVPPPDGSPPLPALFINDFIKAGGYDVVVTKASGSNGVFTGEGLAVVPWFHSAKVRVTFQNISVNQSYQLTRGEIKSVWDPNSRFLIESEQTLAEGGGKGLESTLSYFEADELIEVEGVILNVFINPDGDLVVQTNGGEQVVEREEGKTYAFTDEAGNGYLVDEEGEITKTTATEALAAGERANKSEESIQTELLSIELELIKEALEYLRKEIVTKIEQDGKGPLDEVISGKYFTLPECLPQDQTELEKVLEKIEAYLVDIPALLALIKEDPLNEAITNQLVTQLKGKRPPFNPELSDDDWGRLMEILCPYLVGDNQPELVTIEPIMDYEFAAGIDNDKLEIAYSIRTTETYPLRFAKLEVYKNDGSLVYENKEAIVIGEDKTFLWDGKLNQNIIEGENVYIRYDESPFILRILADLDENFSNPFEAKIVAEVHQYADEWQDASEEIKSRIYVNNAPTGTTKFEYYLMLREQMINKIEIENIGDSGPLGYMDANDTSFTFLGKNIFVHKNYQPILTEIENEIIRDGNFEFYKNRYPIGSYAIRFMNHSQVISDHSFGFALDIDPDNNPQITSKQNLFLKIVTNVDFWNTELSLSQMKNASNRFKQILGSSLSQIIEGFSFIQSYNDDELIKYTTQDIIDGYFEAEIKPLYSNYNLLSQRTTILVNYLWFEKNMNDQMLKELQVDIPDDCLLNIRKIETIISKVQRYSSLLNDGYKKAYCMTSNFMEDYEYLRKYLQQTIDLLETYKSAYLVIINEIEETKQNGYLPASFDISGDRPLIYSFDVGQINGFLAFSRRIDEIVVQAGSTTEEYIEWLKLAETKNTLTRLGETGFYNLENTLVDYFLNSNKIEWGGNWPRKRDWMHFQPTPAYLKF